MVKDFVGVLYYYVSMHFEMGDKSGPDNGNFGFGSFDRPPSDSGTGGLEVPQFLPTRSTDVPPETADTPLSPADYYHPERMRRFYYAGGEVHEGDRPDDGADRAIQFYERYLRERVHFRDVCLAETPSVNDRYPDELDTLQSVLAADFGDAADNTRIVVLDHNDYSNIFFGNNNAPSYPDMVIMSVNPAEAQLYGPNFLLRRGFYEGAYMAGMHESGLIVFEQAGKESEDYRVDELPRGVLRRPITDKVHTDRMGSSFLADGFADSYAIRRVAEHGQPLPAEVPPDEVVMTRLGGGGRVRVQLGYADESSGVPYLSGPANRIHVPFRYAGGVAVLPPHGGDTEGGTVVVKPRPAGLAALGVDLMDAQSPGLFQAMADYIRDPDAEQRIADHINGIDPGLYDELHQIDNTPVGFLYGTKRILGAVGLSEATVGTLR